MKIATSSNSIQNTTTAVKTAFADLEKKLSGTKTDWIVIGASSTYDIHEMVTLLKQLAPEATISGGTSCMGVMTEQGFCSEGGYGLGLFGISDPRGDYGVGYALQDGKPRVAAQKAVLAALEDAGRAHEMPELLCISCAPGQEEQLLLGIEDVVGSDVPVFGGSSADNDVKGGWCQIAGGQVLEDAVVITALFPHAKISFSFHSGYSPTEYQGVATKVMGRTLLEINGKPAAEVYNQWTDGLIDDATQGGNILARSALQPLGRKVGDVSGVPYFRLSHPDSVTAESGLTTFSDIEQGDELFLMEGDRESLITRAERVVSRACARPLSVTVQQEILGSLVVYCGGCMLTILDDMSDVACGISRALEDKPFLGIFTFGEQGTLLGGENRHGNLMISSLTFFSTND